MQHKLYLITFKCNLGHEFCMLYTMKMNTFLFTRKVSLLGYSGYVEKNDSCTTYIYSKGLVKFSGRISVEISASLACLPIPV